MNTQDIITATEAVRAAILANEAQIESLDRAIGDGDHFINVRRGCEAIAALKPELLPLAPADAFQRIGMKLLSTIGGASGPLIGSFFISMGRELEGVAQPDATQFARALAAGVEAIKSRGKADVGEKTMLDVLIPTSRLLLRLAGDIESRADLGRRLGPRAAALRLHRAGDARRGVPGAGVHVAHARPDARGGAGRRPRQGRAVHRQELRRRRDEFPDGRRDDGAALRHGAGPRRRRRRTLDA